MANLCLALVQNFGFIHDAIFRNFIHYSIKKWTCWDLTYNYSSVTLVSKTSSAWFLEWTAAVAIISDIKKAKASPSKAKVLSGKAKA